MGRSSLEQKIPKHVAIVMDGNGRWAQERGLPRTEGHSAGVKVIKPILRACVEKKISMLSIWAFSQDNWSRPISEVDYLLQLFLTALEREVAELHESGIRLRFLGDRAKLAPALQAAMQAAELLTINNNLTALNVVLNYTGRWDILETTKNLTKEVISGKIQLSDITEQYFTEKLSTGFLPEPDLFIRTSGEKRISNFFLWQLAYTELYFSDVAWPDFSVVEFERALESYSARERRFGKTSAQLIGEDYV